MLNLCPSIQVSTCAHTGTFEGGRLSQQDTKMADVPDNAPEREFLKMYYLGDFNL